MKVKQITFDDNSEPATVTVELTTREAAFITKVLGGYSWDMAQAVMAGGGDLCGIYNDFTGCFFNCFWESGVEDVK